MNKRADLMKKKLSKKNVVALNGFIGLLLVSLAPLVKADFEPVTKPTVKAIKDSGVEIERLEAWVGNDKGQQLDSTRSFVIVDCFSNGIVSVKGNLEHSNQINQKLKVTTVLNDVAPSAANTTSFTTNNVGDGGFEFNFNNAVPGIHTLVVKVESDTLRGGSLFINESANSASAAPGILFTCPGAIDEDPYEEEGSDT
jgi:hypothetical protein